MEVHDMIPKSLIAALILMLAIGVVVADGPVMPCFFYGGVTINGLAAQPGTVIVAKINGEIRGTTTVTTAGQYGNINALMVSHADGDPDHAVITFFVNSVQAPQTAVFTEGASTQLDLSSTVVTPTPTITPTPTPTPTPSPTPTPTPTPSPEIRTISQGNTVFIGEQDLDVRTAVNGSPSIAWFRAGDDPLKATPANTVPVNAPGAFYIDPAVFSSWEGNWYQWSGNSPAGPVAFVVRAPQLGVINYDTAGPINPQPNQTLADRYLGTLINFRIDTNLDSIVTQRHVTNGFINLFVRNPNGVTYTTLYTSSPNPTTNPKPLSNLLVGITPYFWSNQTSQIDQFWKTSARDGQNIFRYPAGTYTVWAESFANKMNINNPQGGAISQPDPVNIITEFVTVTSEASVLRSNQFTTTVTGRPNTHYTLWIINNPCNPPSGADCDQPPMILDGQRNVKFDQPGGPYTIGNQLVYPNMCKVGATVRDTVPHTPFDGTKYYADIVTDQFGSASVGFSTSTQTAPKDYTIHVQGLGLDDEMKYAESTVTVQKGAVTVNVASSAILGDNITITGTNTDSYITYLYITGPCQPQCGANLTDPGIPLTPTTYTTVMLNSSARTWNYNSQRNGWVTGNLKIQPGEYTIYATSKPVDACSLNPCVASATATILLKQPTIAATITPEVLVRDCCSQQSVIINGNTTGNPAHLVSMWIFGENKVGDVHYVHTYVNDCCNDFTINLANYVNLKTLPVGKYYVVLQHPMYNHVFDVMIEGDFNGNPAYMPPASTVIGEQNKLYVISSAPIRWSKMFPIEGADARRELAAMNALKDALGQPGIDDIYLQLNFTVKDANAPAADFAGSPVNGSSPLTVSYTDDSLGNPTSWSWDFGDSTTPSTEQNPTHTYLNEGDYTVKLTASKVVNGLTVSDSMTKEKYIHVGPVSLQANFVADQTIGLRPLTVKFTDLTIGSPTQWNWNFGDGGFAIEQNPVHTYKDAATYTVTLSDRNADQTSSLTKPNYITVTAEPTPPPVDPSVIVLKPGWNFVSTPKTLAAGSNTGAIFSNVDMGGRSAWIWNGAMVPPQWVPVISTTPIQPLWGIWIYSVSNNVVNLNFDTTNPMLIPPPRGLPAGWNSIGFTGANQQTARNTYLSVKPNWTTSMGFNATAQKYDQTIFNGDPTELRPLYPTQGYWLYMITPGNLAAIGA